jgi:hypothetical protein
VAGHEQAGDGAEHDQSDGGDPAHAEADIESGQRLPEADKAEAGGRGPGHRPRHQQPGRPVGDPRGQPLGLPGRGQGGGQEPGQQPEGLPAAAGRGDEEQGGQGQGRVDRPDQRAGHPAAARPQLEQVGQPGRGQGPAEVGEDGAGEQPPAPGQQEQEGQAEPDGQVGRLADGQPAPVGVRSDQRDHDGGGHDQPEGHYRGRAHGDNHGGQQGEAQGRAPGLARLLGPEGQHHLGQGRRGEHE